MPKTIVGQWNYPDGNPVNGILYLQLSQSATAVGTAQVAPRNLAIQLVNGAIPLNYSIYANDEIQPAGTYYTITVVSGGGTVWGPENFAVVGSSPININTLVAVGSNFFSQTVISAFVAGATGQVQYNNNGAFGADANFVWNKASQLLTVTGAVNATAGFQSNGVAPSGNVLRGNGSDFVSAQLAYSDLSGVSQSDYYDIKAYGGVADNSTDNHAAFTALAAAVNAYTGPGVPVVNIGCGAGDVAYQSSVGLAVPAPCYIAGGGTLS